MNIHEEKGILYQLLITCWTIGTIYPFVYQWILPSGFIQITLDGPLYTLRGHRL